MPQVALLAVCVIWGSTFFSQQIAVRAIGDNPLAACFFLAARFGIAAVLTVILVPRSVRSLDRRTVLDGIALSVPFFVAMTAQLSGLQSTTPTISALLSNMTIVFTPLLGVLFFRERVRPALLLGAALSLAGVVVMTNPEAEGFGAGEALTLVCAFAFAVQIQLTDVFTKRSSPYGITLVLFICLTLYSSAALAIFPQGRELLARAPDLLSDADVLWPALYTAIAASVFAILLLNLYQRRVSPTRAAIIYMTEPIFAAVFATLIVDEPMTAPKLIGGAIIVVGNLVCELLQKRGIIPA